MNFNELIHQRFSVRSYLQKDVEQEKLLMVLEAGRLAPSAVNYQPIHLIVLREMESLAKIHSAYNRDWIKKAPVVILACADHSQSWIRNTDGKDTADIDVAIAVDHMTLQATELGLGTCWVCNFDAKRCIESFNLPPNIEPLVILPLGYAGKEAATKKRKPLDEIVHWGKFNQRNL